MYSHLKTDQRGGRRPSISFSFASFILFEEDSKMSSHDQLSYVTFFFPPQKLQIQIYQVRSSHFVSYREAEH